MSAPHFDPSKLPYAPRRRNTRPERALPAPPPDEDVLATNAFEAAQAFTSPPSPPTNQSPLPPPPSPPVLSQQSREERSTSGAHKSAAHLHPHVSALPSSSTFVPPNTLTPLRAHYLKKSLVNLQMTHELNLITDPVLGANALGLLGEPFALPESAKREAMARVSEIARAEGRIGDLPFMRFLFHQFLLPFPFLATAPPTFWAAKVQPFLSSFLQTTGYTRQTSLSDEEQRMAESIMTKEERKEVEERTKLWAKVEKHMALMVGVGVKVAGGEEVVRIGQSELTRLEQVQEDRRKRLAERQLPPPPPGTVAGEGESQLSPGQIFFDVNVVGVRVVVEKGRVRNKTHEVGHRAEVEALC